MFDRFLKGASKICIIEAGSLVGATSQKVDVCTLLYLA